MNWQPIETAPKDGTHVLLSDGIKVRTGWFTKWHSPFAAKDAEGWALNWNSEFSVPDETMEPTHWMPLPDAPEGKS